MMKLEEQFLEACKRGNLMLIIILLQKDININCENGFGLRRAIRHNQKIIWQYLLERPDINVNLKNQYGQTALHTAARFNVSDAVSDLLKSKKIDVNSKSNLGSTPAMVAAKYGSELSLKILLNDERVSLLSTDYKGRKVEQLINIAIETCTKQNNIRNILTEAQLKYFIKGKLSELQINEAFVFLSYTSNIS